MFGFTILDLILVLVLISYLVYGLRNGFWVSLGGIVGFVAGAVAAFFSIPLVSSWVPGNGWRLTAIIAAAVVLMILGHALGAGLGRLLRGRLDFGPLRIIDRLLGGAVNVAVAALLMSMLAFSIGSLGVPVISGEIAASQVIGTVDRVTPPTLRTWLAQIRSIAVDDGVPRIVDSLRPVPAAPAPDASVDTAALNAAAASVLKITGTAFQCGQNQTGSGFVVEPGRVVTNAHVVAGVSQPVVQVPGGALPGRVVYFDPVRDLAVLSVAGLDIAPLELGATLSAGDSAAFAGYPAGGPFQMRPATIQSLSKVLVQNIYGADPTPLDIYQLAANVQQGNSGGPLLDEHGRVVGVVFAKSTENIPVGYALTLAELRPVVQKADTLSQPVSAGQCTRKA